MQFHQLAVGDRFKAEGHAMMRLGIAADNRGARAALAEARLIAVRPGIDGKWFDDNVIMTSGKMNAVDLESGLICYVPPNQEVEKIDAKG